MAHDYFQDFLALKAEIHVMELGIIFMDGIKIGLLIKRPPENRMINLGLPPL